MFVAKGRYARLDCVTAIDEDVKPEPLVLGQVLVELLTTLIEKIGDLYVTVPSAGVSTTVSQASPPNPAWNEILKEEFKHGVMRFYLQT